MRSAHSCSSSPREGWQTKIAVTARRGAQARRIVRAADLERLHAEHAVLTAARHERLQLVVGLGERAAAERDADLVRPRRRDETDVLQARVDLLHRAVLHLVVEARVLFAAERRLVDDLVVQGHDDRVLELRVVAPDVAEHVGDVDFVLAVGREQVRRDEAAARAERQAAHVRLLRAQAARSTSDRPCAHRADRRRARRSAAPHRRIAR